MRALFNAGSYRQRAQAGEYRQVLRRDGHPDQPLSGDPVCTRSQLIVYVNSSGERVAAVHQYVRPDGALGGSGMPDPKRLLIEGVLYLVEI